MTSPSEPTLAQLARLSNLLESLTCDTCHYLRQGECTGDRDTKPAPCDRATAWLDAQRIEAAP